MVNMMKLMQQAASMQKNVQKLQAELAERTYEFSAGGGAVTATVRGDMSMDRITIDPKAADPSDLEMLEDLVKAAVNGALEMARDSAQKEMAKITGGLGIPGL
ncbi:MAG: YbaB/EbfC family nucleoid-associated protein [bacterium]